MIRGITKPYGEKLSGSDPVRCQKCGKPIGYVTVLARGLTSFQQPIQNVKIARYRSMINHFLLFPRQ